MYQLGRQPLFQLLGAIIVLLVSDAQPRWGLAAAAVWIVWIWMSYAAKQNFTHLQ
jgi:hypothetical protein